MKEDTKHQLLTSILFFVILYYNSELLAFHWICAKSAGTSATPIYTPEYVIGNVVPANSGDYPVRLINGANLRKETAMISAEVVAMLPTIKLV